MLYLRMWSPLCVSHTRAVNSLQPPLDQSLERGERNMAGGARAVGVTGGVRRTRVSCETPAPGGRGSPRRAHCHDRVVDGYSAARRGEGLACALLRHGL